MSDRLERPHCWFRVLKPTGFEKMEEDLNLSREIFGLDYKSLQSVLDAYERVTRSSEKSGLLFLLVLSQLALCSPDLTQGFFLHL